ncbi:MAG: class I SAM-dependent methyltransferase [Akkermansia sp.]
MFHSADLKGTPGYGCPYLKLEQNQKEVPIQIAGPVLPLQFEAEEQGVLFRLDMSAGYSQGIFLDQRDHRRRVRERSRPGMKVLNTFAYTGAFSVYAALGGAQTTTLAARCAE